MGASRVTPGRKAELWQRDARPPCSTASASRWWSARSLGRAPCPLSAVGPPAFAIVKPPIAPIQPGIDVSWPWAGRPCHCLTAKPNRRTPRARSSKATQVAGSPSSLASAPSASASTIAPTAVRPTHHATTNAEPFRTPSIGAHHEHDGDDRNWKDGDGDRERQHNSQCSAHRPRRYCSASCQ